MSREQPRRIRWRLRRGPGVLVVLTLALLCMVWTAPGAAADDPAFTVDAGGVGAVTGIAADTATQTYWVTGAGGSQGSVDGLSSSGEQKGSIGFRADVQSVQALAYRSGRLYVGDIGDTKHDRDHVTVYYFDNVTPGDGVITYHAWDFRYPDGAKDAKAMVVDDTGRVFFITTGSDAGVYAAPKEPSRQGVNDLTRVGDAPGDDITDAVALGPDRWAVRTKDAVQVIDPSSYQVTASAALPVSDGQALGTPLTGSTLLAVDAGSSPAVFSLSVPTTVAPPTTTASPTPTPTASASASAAEQPTGDQEHTGAERRTGTWVAIGLAAALAVLAGLAVFLAVGRRGAGDDEPAEPDEAEGDETFATAEPLGETEPADAGGPTATSAFQPLAPLPTSGLPDDLPSGPATPTRVGPGAARSAGMTDPDDTVRPPRRARDPGDIEDDDDDVVDLEDDDDLDQTVLRSRLPRPSAPPPTEAPSDESAVDTAPSDETVRRPPPRGGGSGPAAG